MKRIERATRIGLHVTCCLLVGVGLVSLQACPPRPPVADGTFGAKTDFAAGDAPRSVALADVNADGNLDAVTANGNSDNISVLFGNGAGGFGAANNFAAGDGPAAVALADVNGDSMLDAVTANAGSDDVSVLLGNIR